MKFNEETAAKIQQVLTEKGVDKPCSCCGNLGFIVIKGFFRNYVQHDLTHTQMGGENIPTIAVGCSNCGHINQFSAKYIFPEAF